MPIDIRRNYPDMISNDELEKKRKHQEELDQMMKNFLAKGGKVEKLAPGSAAGVATLNKDKRPMYTDAEIKELAKEREDGSRNSKTSEWFNND
jgi:hypothetical protein